MAGAAISATRSIMYAYTIGYYSGSDMCLVDSSNPLQTFDVGVPKGGVCFTSYLPVICEQGLCVTAWASSLGSSSVDLQVGICSSVSNAKICSDYCLYAEPEAYKIDECYAYTNTTSFMIHKSVSGGFITLVIVLPLAIILLCYWRYKYNRTGHVWGCLECNTKKKRPVNSTNTNNDEENRQPSALDIMYGKGPSSTTTTTKIDIPNKGGISTANPLVVSTSTPSFSPAPPTQVNYGYPPPGGYNPNPNYNPNGGYGYGGASSPYRL